jgi:DnaK suppressor protein
MNLKSAAVTAAHHGLHGAADGPTTEQRDTMSSYLTHGQKALLEASLVQRQHALDRRLNEQTQAQSRAEHARDVLLQDGDDAPQRESEREMDMALTDIETQELGAVSEALRRLPTDNFGICADCATEIPFDRLKAEPWALRCVSCESRRERQVHA